MHCGFAVKYLCTVLLSVSFYAHGAEYSIEAIRYADSLGDPVSSMVMGAPEGEKIDSVFAFWLIRGHGRTFLFDSGFHRERWFADWEVADYLRPDQAIRLAGVSAEEVTDIIVSHIHWDHIGGIDLFPNATVWIQKDEFRHYTGDAWQPGMSHGGVDPEDVQELVRLNVTGRLRLVDGDNQQITEGIRAFTGARHTFASQYILVEGDPSFVLASDNVYLYRNMEEGAASATFSREDHAANIAAQKRMIELAGTIERVIPGHDALQFERFPGNDRVVSIK